MITLADIVFGILHIIDGVNHEGESANSLGYVFFSIPFSFIFIDLLILKLFFNNVAFYKELKLKKKPMTKLARLNLALVYILGATFIIEDIIEQSVRLYNFLNATETSEVIKVYFIFIIGATLDLLNAVGIMYMFMVMGMRLNKN
jgi:hypothetical protein